MVTWLADASAGAAAPTAGQLTDTLLMLVSASMVMLIVPGVALFYGGMSGRAGAAQAFRAALSGTAVVVVLAVAGGYGLIAGPALIPHVLGMPDWGLASLLGGLGPHGLADADPYPLARAGYLVALCAVAVAILGAAVASRVTLRAWVVFVGVWSLLVLFPACYAVFALSDGWAVAGMNVVDFGGALPVSLAAGSGAAGVILACGRRGHPPTGIHSLPLVATGGSLIWFGWFGLTVGSEGAVDAFSSLIWINTLIASAGGALTWIIVDRVMLRRPTITSALCGAVSGLVAIAPASGVVTTGWSLLLGALAALACATMVDLAARARFGVPMAICVIHIVASLVGLFYIGLFSSGGGLIESGNFDLFVSQAVAGITVAAGSFFLSLLVAVALRYTIGLTRVRYPSDDAEPDEIPARRGEPVPAESDRAGDPAGGRAGP
ncbi:ammonium transporter [Leifsonia sp. NPDC058248]|uniref:ammonium transporter n=1 Tax=Leifsonia sp. NPDC058248 TaxID=3346402 RepID=UPI0036D8089A